MPDLRGFVLWARNLLTQEASQLLQQVYRLDASSGERLPIPQGHLLENSTAAKDIREQIEKLLDDEVDAGLTRQEAVAKLIKETAFTHLNRCVAFKLMEARGLVRSPLARHHEANGFKMWLGARPEEAALYNEGDSPNDRDGFGEAPRDRAYRHFLRWQSGELSREIRVLFDPNNAASLLFPRPGVLKELIDALNADDRKDDWSAGNEETIGWVYQYFNSEELEAAFTEARLSGKKFAKEDIPSVTQLFTPRPTVRFLVDNTLGRLWLAMHPDSKIEETCPYFVARPGNLPAISLKLAKEIRVLDPATGTMHFGLVAFDIFVAVYREELLQAGQPGWPAQPSVANEAEIPASILANNLFGIDIDLRAVQLAALALYLKAKSINKTAVLTESNLSCSDVAIFRGQHLAKITSEMALPRGFTRELFVKFRDSLEEASMMGSLVRLERHFHSFESDQLRQSIDDYVAKKRAEGIDESYFANETGKGLRLLDLLERQYDVVFTNPPYVSGRKMNSDMSRFMKENYKDAKGDLYAAFIQRCLELTSDSGVMGMLTMHSFMFISSYEKLRAMLNGNAVIEAVAHYGPGLFAVGNPGTLQTAAFVLRREQLEMERREARGVYFRLVKEPDAESKRTAFEQALARRRVGEPDSRVYEYRQGDFAAISGSPWVYWILGCALDAFRSNSLIRDLAQPRVGLQTSDNFRFLRLWWEVGLGSIALQKGSLEESAASGLRWFPIMKGGGFRRWYGNQEFVVNYCDDGREIKEWAAPLYGDSGWSRIIKCVEFYFREGLTWSALSSRGMSARLMPTGFIIGQKGPACFFSSENKLYAAIAIINSKAAAYLLKITSPTIMFEVGQLGMLPLPQLESAKLPSLAAAAISLARSESQEDETTFDFATPPTWPDGVGNDRARHRNVTTLEEEIDEEVYRLYAFSPDDRQAIEEELAALPEVNEEVSENESADEAAEAEAMESFSLEELAHRWVSYALGIALGRFDRPGLEAFTQLSGLMVVEEDHPGDLAYRVIAILTAIHGDTEAGKIIRTAIGGNGDLRNALAAYLIGPLFRAHVKRYRKRPVYWLVQSPKQRYSVYLFHERATDQTLALIQGKEYLGGRIFQLGQQHAEAIRQEAVTDGRQKAQWRKRTQDLAEELADLEAFDQAITATTNEQIVDAEGRTTTTRWTPEFDDGVLLNAAPLYRLTPGWKRADPKLDLKKAWEALKNGDYPWAKTAMRYWPQETLAACKDNKSYRIAHGLE